MATSTGAVIAAASTITAPGPTPQSTAGSGIVADPHGGISPVRAGYPSMSRARTSAGMSSKWNPTPWPRAPGSPPGRARPTPRRSSRRRPPAPHPVAATAAPSAAPRARSGQRPEHAEAEHADAVVAVVPTLLHDGEAATHRLSDADLHRVARPCAARPSGSRPRASPTRRPLRPHSPPPPDRTPALRLRAGSFTHAEMIDRDEDPAALGVPVGLRAPPRTRTREVRGEVAPRVARPGLGEAHDRIGARPVLVSCGTVTVSATWAGSPRPAASVTSTSRSIERTPMVFSIYLGRSAARRPGGWSSR